MKLLEVGKINERIQILVDHYCSGDTVTFARILEIQPQLVKDLVQGVEAGPSWVVVQKLLHVYQELNPTWLFFGRGQMLLASKGPLLEEAKETSGQIPTLLLFELTWQKPGQPNLRSHWHRFMPLPITLIQGYCITETALACYVPGMLPEAKDVMLTVMYASYHLGRAIVEAVLHPKQIKGSRANYEQIVKQLLAQGWVQAQGDFSEN